MRTFGIIGFPLSHSFSQKYFTARFTEKGIADAEFKNFPIAGIEMLPGILSAEPHLQGFGRYHSLQKAGIALFAIHDSCSGANGRVQLHQGSQRNAAWL